MVTRNFNFIIDSFDVIRYKKDKVKIIDFGPIDESTTKGTLFTYQELHNEIENTPEFRFIAEDVGVQPKTVQHFCVPQEINEFYQSRGEMSMIDALREVWFIIFLYRMFMGTNELFIIIDQSYFIIGS